MSNIPVHDPEKKRESRSSEERRVRFAVSGDTVGVDEFLVSVGELVGVEVGGGLGPWLGHYLEEGRHGSVGGGVGLGDGLAGRVELGSDYPTLRGERRCFRDVRKNGRRTVVGASFFVTSHLLL